MDGSRDQPFCIEFLILSVIFKIYDVNLGHLTVFDSSGDQTSYNLDKVTTYHFNGSIRLTVAETETDNKYTELNGNLCCLSV